MRPVQYNPYLAAEDPSPLGPYKPVDPDYPPHIVYSNLAESHPGGAALSSPHIPHEFHWPTDEELATRRRQEALERQRPSGSPQVSDQAARLAAYFAMRKAAQLAVSDATPAQPTTMESPLSPGSHQSNDALMQGTVCGLPLVPEKRESGLPSRQLSREGWAGLADSGDRILAGIDSLDSSRIDAALEESARKGNAAKGESWFEPPRRRPNNP